MPWSHFTLYRLSRFAVALSLRDASGHNNPRRTRAKIDGIFVFSCGAHNLLRLPRLIATHDQQSAQQHCAINGSESEPTSGAFFQGPKAIW